MTIRNLKGNYNEVSLAGQDCMTDCIPIERSKDYPSLAPQYSAIGLNYVSPFSTSTLSFPY